MSRTSALALVFAGIVLASPRPSAAQGTREDYARADGLDQKLLRNLGPGVVLPHWFDSDRRFWYRRIVGDRRWEFIVVDATAATQGPAFDHAALAEALLKAEGVAVRADRLPLNDRIVFEPGGAVRFEAFDKAWIFDPAARTVSPGPPLPQGAAVGPFDPGSRGGRPRQPGQGSPRGRRSPDGRYHVFLSDGNLGLHDSKTQEEFRLTDDGNSDDAYDPRVFWSPDSQGFVALKTARGEGRKVYAVASSPADQLQPKLDSYDYLKPGDRIPVTTPYLFHAATRTKLPLDRSLFPYAWSVDEFRWAPDSSQFTFVYNQRGHQVLRVLAVDAATGAVRTIVEETSPTFVDYSQKFFLWFDPKGDDLLWMSERSGWNHLYRYNARTGALKNAVTTGEWVVRGVDHVDQEARQIWFRACGIRPGQDPYHVHYARVNFDGTGLVVLTEGDGTHWALFSPDRKFFIDRYSRIDTPEVILLRSARDGKPVLTLERPDSTLWTRSGMKVPEPFVAKGRDGKTDIYGVIYRPSNFDPWRKYPVIEHIYAGPQGARVPKGNFPAPREGPELAELGFIVVQIDGMGTNWRSKAFHDVCWKNLGDAGFSDRILWMNAAAQAEPAMDLTRVGIYGGSAGGQNALGALLFHGDFYKVAAADCGCHDNRMDKVWWNEAWMGWPVGPEYAAQSNVTNAHKLRGKLLLTVGELDHNVDPASTMQVVNALIKAGKQFDLVVFPGADHGAGESPYGRNRRRDFFVKHLLGVEPPDRNADR